MNSAATLPDGKTDSDAQLPARYEAAQRAIAECHQIDECKTWSDKAAALASYARQSKDDSLRVMAVRIQARAERRCGELLKSIPRADEGTRYGRVGAVPPVTRTQAATNAGLSERQRKTALRIAAVPETEFNRQVESPTPPTVTRLAEMGKSSFGSNTRARARDEPIAAGSPTPEALQVRDAIAQIGVLCGNVDLKAVAREFNGIEAAELRRAVVRAVQWLDRFAQQLMD